MKTLKNAGLTVLAIFQMTNFNLLAETGEHSSAQNCTKTKKVPEYHINLKSAFIAESPIHSSPLVTRDGRIVVGADNGKVYFFNPDGSKVRDYKTGGAVRSSAAELKDGGMVIGSDDGSVYFFKPNGRLSAIFKTKGAVKATPVIKSDGTVSVASSDGNTYFLNQDGTLILSRKTFFPPANPVPVFFNDGSMVIGSTDGNVSFMNADGTLKATFKTGGKISAPARIAKDGTVIIGSEDGKIYFLNPDATLKATFDTESKVDSTPAITKDGKIVVGAEYGSLYFLNPPRKTGNMLEQTTPTKCSLKPGKKMNNEARKDKSYYMEESRISDSLPFAPATKEK